MSTRRERAERARRRLTCRGCGVFRAGPHFDPFTKTYICQPPKVDEAAERKVIEDALEFWARYSAGQRD